MKNYAGKNNKIFGFDSFEGMPDITDKDLFKNKSSGNKFAGKFLKCNIIKHFFKEMEFTDNPKKWVNVNVSGGIENVYKTFSILNLNMTNVFLIKGFFQNTMNLQENIDNIGEIAILRLDSDWYESTMFCLEKLYTKVVNGGVIIIDDYGCFVGAKNATDDFRKRFMIKSLLIKTDKDEYYWIK